MKIGLLRHFKVNLKYPRHILVTYDEVFNWYEKYGTADVLIKDVDMCGVEWQKCFASPLKRASVTSKTVYKGEITVVDELKELDVLPVLKGTRRKPFLLWGLMLKIRSTQSNYITQEFEAKVSAFLEGILKNNNCDILIVCHGFVMTYMQKLLMEKGFKGKNFFIPNYNKIYIYEKK